MMIKSLNGTQLSIVIFQTVSILIPVMLVPNAFAADVNKCLVKMRLLNILNIKRSQRNFILIELSSLLNYKCW